LKGPYRILGIGELLWDMLPEGPQLGGAPANFAVMAGRLGNHSAILSRIGRDELGQHAVNRLNCTPLNTEFLQVDPQRATGRVNVSLTESGPQYAIEDQSAWDFLELTDEWVRMAERADAICFGTLAQRNASSRQTIQTLAAETSATCVRVFDVNLRAPFYSGEVIQESLELASVVKMNEDEAPLIMGLLGLAASPALEAVPSAAGSESLRAAAHALLEEFPNLHMAAITRGGRGSLLVKRDQWHEHPGVPAQVADTIGAGDTFTAALVHYLLRGASLATLNEAGNRWGAWMASQSGAMPHLPDSVRDDLAAAIDRASTR
jgi:fructokinase